MAQLFRFLCNDGPSSRSEVFTFMIPSSFILDSDSDLKSRDFTSSNQKWSLSFSKVINSKIKIKTNEIKIFLLFQV